jgi:hypothetical protein
VLVILGYYILSVFVDVSGYYLWWLALIGFTWGFHFTFTISTLMQKQTDIKECGSLFSYTLIYLLNLLGIGLWTVIVSDVTLEQMIGYAKGHIIDVFVYIHSCGAHFFRETT